MFNLWVTSRAKNKNKGKKLDTIAFFPVRVNENKTTNKVFVSTKPQKKLARQSQRGIAIMIAMMVIAMMFIFSSDLIVTSQVNAQLAASQRDQIKAEFLAKSALNVGYFLLSIDFVADVFLSDPKSPIPTPPTDGPSDIWGLLNGIPIGAGSAELLAASQEAFGLTSVNDSGIVDILKLFDGEFVLEVSDEGSKINVNQCVIGRCVEVLKMMKALLECPVEKAFLRDRNMVRPNEVIYKIKDFIDTDRRAEPETNLSDEDDPYQKLKKPFKTKNAPFDTLDELKLVDGWTEEMHRIFSPYITVFPFQASANDKARININTAPTELLECLVPSTGGDCKEKFQQSMAELKQDKTNLGNDSASIASTLRQNFCYDAEKDSESSSIDEDPSLKSDRTQWFIPLSSTFRLEAKAHVNGSVKQITSVIQREIPDATKKNAHVYKVLYWKMN